jgi:AICAR transformylase/IMP cyclohydrolase PurH
MSSDNQHPRFSRVCHYDITILRHYAIQYQSKVENYTQITIDDFQSLRLYENPTIVADYYLQSLNKLC